MCDNAVTCGVRMYSKLVTEIESFKNNASKTKSSGESAAGSAAKSDGVAGDGSHITYQLYYRPEQAKFTSNVKVSLCYKVLTYLCKIRMRSH